MFSEEKDNKTEGQMEMKTSERDDSLHDRVDQAENQVNESGDTPNETVETVNWEDKYKDAQEQYIRLYAEFENFRKRTAREKMEMREMAGKDVILSFLSILDDIDRAVSLPVTAENFEDFKQGVELIRQRFLQVLKEKSVEEMNVLKQPFDPDCHEAITRVPAASEDEKGKVIDVVKKGYVMGEKILRYPKVVVGS